MKLTKNLLGILRCPNCGDKAASLEAKGNHLLCPVCNSAFPVVANRPVMLRRDNIVFHVDEYREPGEKKSKRPGGWIARLIPDSSELVRNQSLGCLKALLAVKKPGY